VGRHVAIIAGTLEARDPVTRSILDLANELARNGHTVSLLVFDTVEAELEPGVRLITRQSKTRVLSIGLLRGRRWVMKKLAELNADHTISLHCNFPAEIVVPMRGLLQRRIHSSLQNANGFVDRMVGRLAFLLPSNLMSRWFEKKTLANDGLRSIIALSPRVAASLRQTNTPSTAKVYEVCLPIELASGDAGEAGAIRGKMARALGIEPEAYWVAFAFMRSGLHGLEPLLRAFKPFAEREPASVLFLAGPARYTHLAWIAELGLRDRVRFIGETARLDQLMPCIDLAVYPTNYDPVGWGVREPLRLGRPVVTTTLCDLADAVESSGGTVIPSPPQPQDLLQAIRAHHAAWQGGAGDQMPSEAPISPPGPTLAEAIKAQLGGSA
jgi:glycosyltransferase involved in cell wall biosynthesis